MAHWLFKTEADAWSWDQQKKKGAAGEEWTGVRNFQARSNMRKMKKGDRGFFYHTGDEKQVVREAHPESKAPDWECVDLKAVADMPKPVTLAAIKAEPKLKDMVLVKNSRLSVQPVSEAEWAFVCKMGGL
jgi:predicted RNA-binding protein with PUA-like domain